MRVKEWIRHFPRLFQTMHKAHLLEIAMGYYLNKYPHIIINRIKYTIKRTELGVVENEAAWLKKGTIVKHAAGAINGDVYTNSREALNNTIKRDFSIVEMDFRKCEDGTIVSIHDLENVNLGAEALENEKTFKRSILLGKYTPLLLDDIISILIETPGLYLIVDTHGELTMLDLAEEMICIARKKNNVEILKRIILQLYHFSDYSKIESLRAFDNILFTVYRENYYPWDYEVILKYCFKYKIPVVVIPTSWYLDQKVIDDFSKRNIKLCVHTVNSFEQYQSLMEMGIHGVYSDVL